MQACQIAELESNKVTKPKTLKEFFNDRPFLETLRAYAYALRWYNKIKFGKKDFYSRYVGAKEFDCTKLHAVKIMQEECFSPELVTLKTGRAVKSGKNHLL